MNQENVPRVSGEQRDPREPLPERLEIIQQKLKIRDAKEEELLKLIEQPDQRGKVLTDAWLEREIAQGDLDQLVKNEIQDRLSSV